MNKLNASYRDTAHSKAQTKSRQKSLRKKLGGGMRDPACYYGLGQTLGDEKMPGQPPAPYSVC